MININEGRIGFQAIGNTYSVHSEIIRENVEIAGIPGSWFIPQNASENDIIFYIHGGAFIFGSADSHAPMVSHIAHKLQKRILLIDYRLAPEFPFPQGLNDCSSVIQAVYNENPALKFGIIGDSAGGNLALSTQLFLKDHNGPKSEYTIIISPWTDLECKNKSFERNKIKDVVLSKPYLLEAAKLYVVNEPLTDPLVSPVNGDFEGFSPVMILCGTSEILEDDSIHLNDQLLKYNVISELHEFENELHVWLFENINSEASQQALEMMSKFIKNQNTNQEI